MKKKLLIALVIVIAIAVAGYFFLPGMAVKWALQSDRKASGLQEKKIRVGDHEIVYLEGGKGEPILMVHGFAANKDNWTKFAKFFTPSYRVVAPDLPGFGDSSYVENAPYNTMEQAKRLEKFAAAIGLDKVNIVGNSMGGLIAAKFAILYPDKTLTLGLFDAAGVESPTPSEMAKRLMKGEPNPLVAGSVEEFDRLIQFVFYHPPQIPDFAKKVLVKEAIGHKPRNAKIFKTLTAEHDKFEPELKNIKARTFVLWGDKDRVLDVSSAQVFKNGITNCSVVIMKDCGHLPMIERPEEAAKDYLAFLKGK